MASSSRRLFHFAALAFSFCLTTSLSSPGLADQASTKNAYEKYISGHRLNENGRYQDAINILTQAISQDPKLADAYISRGFSFSKLGNYPSAILDYLRALEIQPQSAYAHNNLGFTYLRNGNYEKALEEFNTALKLMNDFNTAGVYANRAEAYVRIGAFDSAIADADKAILLDPKDHDPYETRGEAYLHKGNEEKALESFKLALDQKYDEATGFHSQGETQFLRANILDQIANRAYSQSRNSGYPVETARMLQGLKQSIAFADSDDELKKSIDQQVDENNYKGLTYKLAAPNVIQIDFAEPIDAKIFCRNMGWSQAYAVSSDPHQNSWRIMTAERAELAQKENAGGKRRISTQFPLLGSWRLQCALAQRPQGELPDTVTGASPAYFLGTYKDAVSSILLRKDGK
ncbi:MAG: tetratricopeptide repeat protein [Candidatus Obscuribacterales bacterium]|jgi:tetratricopeptide (TPR) repeat protein|nr:tetratricopeptide repeat protein [Candidatus Obscuribacterales bacterium]